MLDDESKNRVRDSLTAYAEKLQASKKSNEEARKRHQDAVNAGVKSFGAGSTVPNTLQDLAAAIRELGQDYQVTSLPQHPSDAKARLVWTLSIKKVAGHELQRARACIFVFDESSAKASVSWENLDQKCKSEPVDGGVIDPAWVKTEVLAFLDALMPAA
jgi:hypothetical protein